MTEIHRLEQQPTCTNCGTRVGNVVAVIGRGLVCAACAAMLLQVTEPITAPPAAPTSFSFDHGNERPAAPSGPTIPTALVSMTTSGSSSVSLVDFANLLPPKRPG